VNIVETRQFRSHEKEGRKKRTHRRNLRPMPVLLPFLESLLNLLLILLLRVVVGTLELDLVVLDVVLVGAADIVTDFFRVEFLDVGVCGW
jgi:hypothetical protein